MGVLALRDACPHKKGPLSQGIVHGRSVTCPLHNWVIDLASGAAQGADEGCAQTIALRVENGRILIDARALAPAGA
jgi:nitrite reductase (NADH) small subunit